MDAFHVLPCFPNPQDTKDLVLVSSPPMVGEQLDARIAASLRCGGPCRPEVVACSFHRGIEEGSCHFACSWMPRALNVAHARMHGPCDPAAANAVKP